MHVQNHYDAYARNNIPKGIAEAIQKRNDSPLAALKKYHNLIKRRLLAKISRGSRVLDLACGRGGDIGKWKDAGFAFVVGVDISPKQIEEARQRHMWLGVTHPEIQFVAADVLKEDISLSGPVDAVSCMFAAHYFCESRDSLDTFFHQVAKALKPGGLLVGTAPNGDSILDFLPDGTYTSKYLTLDVCSPERDALGQPVHFGLSGTVTEGDNLEYLLFPKLFMQVAREHGLVPDHQVLESLDMCEPVKDGFATFKANYTTDPHLKQISKMFGAFVFRKVV